MLVLFMAVFSVLGSTADVPFARCREIFAASVATGSPSAGEWNRLLAPTLGEGTPIETLAVIADRVIALPLDPERGNKFLAPEKAAALRQTADAIYTRTQELARSEGDRGARLNALWNIEMALRFKLGTAGYLGEEGGAPLLDFLLAIHSVSMHEQFPQYRHRVVEVLGERARRGDDKVVGEIGQILLRSRIYANFDHAVGHGNAWSTPKGIRDYLTYRETLAQVLEAVVRDPASLSQREAAISAITSRLGGPGIGGEFWAFAGNRGLVRPPERMSWTHAEVRALRAYLALPADSQKPETAKRIRQTLFIMKIGVPPSDQPPPPLMPADE